MCEVLLTIREVSRSFVSEAETVWAVREATGKSTLIDAIAGLDSPDCGQIVVDSQDVGATQ